MTSSGFWALSAMTSAEIHQNAERNRVRPRTAALFDCLAMNGNTMEDAVRRNSSEGKDEASMDDVGDKWSDSAWKLKVRSDRASFSQ